MNNTDGIANSNGGNRDVAAEPPSTREASAEEPPGKRKWDDWRWQLKNRITTVEEIQKLSGQILSLSEKASEKFPISITPYYFDLIKKIR